MVSKKENQVSFTVGKNNIKLLDGAFKLYGCNSRSELMKKIIENWVFNNKPFIDISNGKP
ncbi:hypothetical protein HOE04_02030 [archaeon]|jgi:hypothetical protein|nr:hypothetical protein [archaeon]